MMHRTGLSTVGSLSTDLRALGVAAGGVVLLHASMRSLGFVAGDAQAVVQAFLDVLGPDGTLMVPTHTPDNSDPAGWHRPPVPEAWWAPIREQAPGFDPLRTPSRWMGVLAETVRTWPGARRSDHPQVSFAALGPHAATIVGEHRLDDALGEHSPLGALYRLGGMVLLLGCGYDSNTSLHLAEWRQPSAPHAVRGASIRQPDGSSRWTTWLEVETDESDFERLGADFQATGAVTVGPVGAATARLMSQPRLVDFATVWMATHRGQRGDQVHAVATSRPPLAERLDMTAHPEGGWFRETWRSAVTFAPDGYDGPRSTATAIYFLLHPGERSRWHVVRSDELWFWHWGGPLELRLGGAGADPADAGPADAEGADADGADSGVIVVGGDVTAGQRPQARVPAGVRQCAAPAGDEPVLVSCVVSPGFDFADFRLREA
jgi:aminoglycoside 3-N-acetyltransferase